MLWRYIWYIFFKQFWITDLGMMCRPYSGLALSPAEMKKNKARAANEKPNPRWDRLCRLISPPCQKFLNNWSKTHFNWFNGIHFNLIYLTLLFRFLFFKTNLNRSYVLLLDTFSINMQWGFCKYFLSKKIKTDIFNKSAFASRKLIVII